MSGDFDRTRLNIMSAVLIACVAAGCGRETSPPVPAPVGPVVSTKTYRMKGVVREVDAAQKALTVAHEAMPGFMGAMTMPFTIDKPGALDDVQPGDEVEAPIVVEFEGDRVKSYRLEDLVVVNPAPATIKFSTGPGGPSVSVKKPVLKPGELVPDFAMTTQEGKPLKLSDLRGKVVVFTFIYTRCPLPDFCPASDREFGELAKALEPIADRRERVRLLSVSFDPEHDTPEVLRTHARLRGAKPPFWSFAVATHEELRKVAESLGLTYGPAKDEIIHNLSTAVVGPDGRLLKLYEGKAGVAWNAGELAKIVVESLRVSQK